MKNHVCVCTCMFYIKTYNIVELPWWKNSEQLQEFRRISHQFIVIWYMYIGDHLWSQNNRELVKHLFWKWCDIWFYLSRADEDGAGEKDARHLIRKIRRQVRFLNRKWAELNQDSNEWQAQLDEVSEVSLGCFFLSFTHGPAYIKILKSLLFRCQDSYHGIMSWIVSHHLWIVNMWKRIASRFMI